MGGASGIVLLPPLIHALRLELWMGVGGLLVFLPLGLHFGMAAVAKPAARPAASERQTKFTFANAKRDALHLRVCAQEC